MKPSITWVFLGLVAVLAGVPAQAQFNSGSTGSDGALTFTTPGTYDFDPAALGLNPSGDNVFNFTTIHIASGVTLNLKATKLRWKPVVWLASGDVKIEGRIDLSGQGAVRPPGLGWRLPTEPGPGGYEGGTGGLINPETGGVTPPTAGGGPGGGPAGTADAANGGHAGYAVVGPKNATTPGGAAYGSVLLTPLLGGSGGGGEYTAQCSSCAGGGAGGGAFRLISSTKIELNGTISSNGGAIESGSVYYNTVSGAGSGGAIHLLAPVVTGTISLYATGGSSGRILVECNNSDVRTYGSPAAEISIREKLSLPASTLGQPSLRVTSIGGVAVPINANAARLVPDVSLSASGPVALTIVASNVPTGTVPNIGLMLETGAMQYVDCGALAGSLANSTSSCNVALPQGVTIVSVRAKW